MNAVEEENRRKAIDELISYELISCEPVPKWEVLGQSFLKDPRLKAKIDSIVYEELEPVIVKNFGDIYGIVAEKTGTDRSYVKQTCMSYMFQPDVLAKTSEELVEFLVDIINRR